jgi:hypothetical protein
MKNIGLNLSLAGSLILLNGCAIARTVSFNPETKTYDKATVFIFLNKSAAENYKGLHQTKAAKTMLSFDGANTETQTDALKAVVEGAVAGALKVAKPIP